ncbi:hypothetical protein BDP81DRAFT_31694 [Colletotrichum phormii]|uniref:Uncharacterized protein n=1 Tax=Colletotrichum phormii TaxID=359342 RepID=A0AAI9ZSC8_9PEZI|nr:uncharacterized protein BDP81DRAFT_31694 [Colletotrichum phormii]KAK1635954.1 hypothetical protein BDP81DRAFT_31694 [Colletotrichum phormii]
MNRDAQHRPRPSFNGLGTVYPYLHQDSRDHKHGNLSSILHCAETDSALPISCPGIQYPTSGWTIEFEVQPWRQRVLRFYAPVVYLPLFLHLALCQSLRALSLPWPTTKRGHRQTGTFQGPNHHLTHARYLAVEPPPWGHGWTMTMLPHLKREQEVDWERGLIPTIPSADYSTDRTRLQREPYISSQHAAFPPKVPVCIRTVQLPNRSLSGPF